MYLMKLSPDQAVQWVFFTSDPRLEGCPHPIIDGVEYEDATVSEVASPFDKPPPASTAFGRSKADLNRYKTFNNREELAAADFEALSGRAALYPSWRAYDSNVVSIAGGRRHGETSHG
jgi:hypothetical protein